MSRDGRDPVLGAIRVIGPIDGDPTALQRAGHRGEPEVIIDDEEHPTPELHDWVAT